MWGPGLSNSSHLSNAVSPDGTDNYRDNAKDTAYDN